MGKRETLEARTAKEHTYLQADAVDAKAGKLTEKSARASKAIEVRKEHLRGMPQAAAASRTVDGFLREIMAGQKEMEKLELAREKLARRAATIRERAREALRALKIK